MTVLKKLPDAELEIMLLMWQAEQPVPRNYFDKALKDEKNWADSTVLSLLSRLMEKKYITCEKRGNKNYYSPLVKKEDYLALENKSFMKKLYQNSLNQFITAFSQTNPLSDDDIEELHKLLNSLRSGV
ncbi:MAG: BlaI/MecI/CopY family transcriptional regulator [Ruminococcaceae bacterium]|nr:BlaI/MecI/CopY family transcriptional regulator [Oscillospiraceae bacterium]